jgi:hypothetical protein
MRPLWLLVAPAFLFLLVAAACGGHAQGCGGG